MSENFEMILNRGNSLNKLSELSTTLKEDSKKVYKLILFIPYLVRKGCKEIKNGILDKKICNIYCNSRNTIIHTLFEILCILIYN